MTGDPQVRLEVGPVDKVAREDINKFLREMTEESSAQGNNRQANIEIFFYQNTKLWNLKAVSKIGLISV